MAAPFDPYHRWLSIPPEEQPPNHYRLLGIQLFEADPDMIESAADRQMLYLQTFKTSQHTRLSQQLLNEIAAAKLCLLAPVRKAEYDARLRTTQSPSPQQATHEALPVAMPLSTPVVPLATESSIPQVHAPSTSAVRAPRAAPPKRAIAPAAWAGIGLSAALLMGVAIWLVALRGPVQPRLGAVADVALDEGRQLTLQLQPADNLASEGWSYELLPSAPEGMTLDRRTGTLSWTPHESQGAGIYPVRVRASIADSPALFDEIGFTVSVKELHQPPSFETPALPPLGDGGIAAQLRARDLDLPVDRVTYRSTISPTPQNPPELNPTTGEFRWQPATADLGTQYSITFRAAKSKAPQIAAEQVVQLTLPDARQLWEGKLAQAGVQVQMLSSLQDAETGARIHSYRLNGQQALMAEFASTQQASEADESTMATFRQRLSKNKELAVYRRNEQVVAVENENQELAAALDRALGPPLRVIPALAAPASTPAPAGGKPAAAQVAITEEELTALLKPTAKQRAAAPDDAERKKTEETLKQAFDLVKAKKPPEKVAIADKLFNEAQKANNDALSRYVLLDVSSRLAMEANDVVRAWKALDPLIQEFDVDGLKRKQDALKEATPKAATAAAVQLQLAKCYRELADMALAQADHDEAVKMMKAADSAVRKAKNRELAEEYKQRLGELTSIKEAYDRASTALATWKDQPDDAGANLELGSYLCFWRDHWDQGLPLLVKANEGPLTAAAKLDSAKPTTLADQLAAGDAWLEAGEKGRALDKKARLLRARYWLERARKQGNRLNELEIDKKLAGLPERPVPVLAAQVAPAQPGGAPVAIAPPANLPAPLPAGNPGLDRLAAQVVLRLEGNVTLADANGATIRVTDEAALPNVPFVVREVRFKTELKDEAFLFLQDLKFLEQISCGLNSRLTNAGVALLKNLRSLKSFSNTSNGGSRLTDPTLETLAQLPNLETVRITDGRFTDRGVSQICSLPRLKTLDCPESNCSDAPLQALAKNRSLTMLSLGGRQITDVGARHLGALVTLSSLTLKKSSLDDPGVAALSRLNNLTSLTFDGQFSDGSVDQLGRLPNLTRLAFGSPKLTAAGLARLVNLPKLTSLELTVNGPLVNDQMLAAVAKRPQLRSLTVWRTDTLTDRGLATLANHPGISSLTLRGARLLTNDALSHFSKLPNLQFLFLYDAPLTDAGLAQLRTAAALRQLSLYNSQATAQGVLALKQSLPQCNVFLGTN